MRCSQTFGDTTAVLALLMDGDTALPAADVSTVLERAYAQGPMPIG